MTYKRVVSCDRDGCEALFIGEAPWGLDLLRHTAIRAEWRIETSGTATCPADAAGRGPVLETGECPRCHGRTRTLADVEECMYCLGRVPHPADDDDLVDDTDQAADAARYSAPQV